MVDVCNESFERGMLPESQRSAVFSLLFKKMMQKILQIIVQLVSLMWITVYWILCWHIDFRV